LIERPHHNILYAVGKSKLANVVWKPCTRVFKRICLPATRFLPPFGVFDRTGKQWIVVAVDGTRQAARQRALPQTEALPAPHRRFDIVALVCCVGSVKKAVPRSSLDG
jgi:hypothetical protein